MSWEWLRIICVAGGNAFDQASSHVDAQIARRKALENYSMRFTFLATMLAAVSAAHAASVHSELIGLAQEATYTSATLYPMEATRLGIPEYDGELEIPGAPSALGIPGSEARDASPQGRLTPGEHTADLGDVRLWYKVAGSGPFVLASSVSWGLGSGYLSHPGGIAPLEQHFTMIYVNSRGTPPSSRPPDETRMSTSIMADDLERLRQYLAIPKLDLIGHSAGAMIVLGYAERYPSHVRKLVLVDGALLDTFPTPRTDEIIDSWRADPRYAQAIAYSDHPQYPPTDEGVH